jgi:RNA polymerase sigma-70 factor (ECF subfamily)
VDRDLVVRAQRGDRDAFGVLARSHADRLFAIGQRILRDAGLAEDALQTSLVAAWRQLPALRDADKFGAWITRLLVHECYAESRRRSRMNSQIRVVPMSEPTSGDDILAFIDRDELERGFRRLPPDQRTVLVLHHYVGLEPAEIAETLGVPAGTVRSRLHYGHRAMRAVLEADARSTAGRAAR